MAKHPRDSTRTYNMGIWYTRRDLSYHHGDTPSLELLRAVWMKGLKIPGRECESQKCRLDAFEHEIHFKDYGKPTHCIPVKNPRGMCDSDVNGYFNLQPLECSCNSSWQDDWEKQSVSKRVILPGPNRVGTIYELREYIVNQRG